jgi:hypothetical protein
MSPSLSNVRNSSKQAASLPRDSVVDPDGIRIDFGRLDPDQRSRRAKRPTKIEDREELSCFEVLGVLFF